MHAGLRLFAALALALGCAAAPARAQDQNVLPPEQAYPYTVKATGKDLLFDFALPKGYYLYRKRFGFQSKTGGVSLGPAQLPKGQIHEDEYFGKQVIYRGRFQIRVPYTQTGSADELDYVLSLQGCADIGICYPPQHWNASVDLPAPSVLAGGQAASLILGKNAKGGNELPADQAFQMNARFDSANQLTVHWQIQPGYYLYRDKLGFSADGPIELGTPKLPAGEAHEDQNFGASRVFYKSVEAVIPFSRSSPDAIPVTIHAKYQGCKENSICYPPGEQTMSVVVPASSEFAAASGAGTQDKEVSEQDRLAKLALNGSWLLVLGTFYGLGLLLAFTPCVLPMVPILSGIIAGHGTVSAGRGFALSLSYVMGMAVTYTVAGALAALAGSQIQAIFQKPWIIALFAGLFVVLALGMFGLFQLQMPAAIQTRLAGAANRQKAGSFAGTAVMGALSSLIVTTCVAPPLVATLAVIGQTGDVARGAGALFALSLGMGSPLLLVGASAGKLLPKAGAWMNAVKAGFGVMMLGVAIWMLERVLPGAVTLVLWAVLVFLTGVFLGAFEPLGQHPAPVKRLAKGVGVLACLYGALMLIGATLGGQDPLRPLPQNGVLAARTGTAPGAAALSFQAIHSVAGLESALAAARSAHRPVMVDFTADWCVSCKEMEHKTFPKQNVVQALQPFVLLRADVTANDAGDKALLKYFHSFGPPTIAFFDAQGRPQPGYKLVGYVPADEFAAHVEKLAAL
jgi:thiol:disulfide interchange protein DsbD